MSTALARVELPSFSLDAAIVADRDSALEKSAMIAKVADSDQNIYAADILNRLQTIRREVEKSRKIAKAPAIEYGRRLDATCEEFLCDIGSEERRIATLLGDYQALLRQRSAAVEARLKAEIAERERQRNAEIARVAAEDARRRAESEEAQNKLAWAAAEAAAADAADAKRKLDLARAESERQEALARAETIERVDQIQAQHDAEIRMLQEQATYNTQETPRGLATKQDWEITITDIWLLARSHPTCVRIWPMTGEIKSLLNAGADVKGVSAKRVERVTTRGSRAIDV